MSVLELRIYTIAPGRGAALHARFRDHTNALFREHGMTPLGYWTARSGPERLIYLLRHDGDPESNWEGFRNDPRWIAARAASVADGELTIEIDSDYLVENDLSTLADPVAERS